RVVPASRLSKNGPLLLNVYPLPNIAQAGGNFLAGGVTRTDNRDDLLRADYYLSSTTQAMFRWSHDTWNDWNPFNGSNLGNVPGGQARPGYNTTVSLVHTFSPTAVSSSSFSASGNHILLSPDPSAIGPSALRLT